MTHSPKSFVLIFAILLTACEGGEVELDRSPDDGAPVDRSDAGTQPGRTPTSPMPLDAGPALDGGNIDDAGPLVDSGSSEPPPAPIPDGVPIFVAQGDVGRTTVSCDEGRTWIADRTTDASIRCFDRSRGNFDCNHHAGAARGVSFGEGEFYLTFGWGTPGRVARSTSGANWSPVFEGRAFSGVSRGAGVIFAGARFARYSTDDGRTSRETGPTIQGYNVRRSAFVPHGEGRFVLVGEAGDIAISRDGGASFVRPTVASDCGGGIQWSGGIAYGNGTLLVMGGNGVACRSTDGGSTWTRSAVDFPVTSDLLFDGETFVAFGGGRRHRSADGGTWTSAPISPAIDVGAVARSDRGIYVAVRAGRRDYEAQEFYRSEDGSTWSRLPEGAYRGGHPIRFIAFGRAPAGTACGR